MGVLAGIAYDPQIRGYLVVAVAVAVLMGSVYLLLGTNLGGRLGFLVTMAGLFGWMTILGTSWWIYGIGMKGTAPTWEVQEVHFGDMSSAANPLAAKLNTSELPDPDTLADAEPEEFKKIDDKVEPTLGGGWKLLAESNPARGEAVAVVDAFLSEDGITLPTGNPEADLTIDGPEDYKDLYAFEQGGKVRLPDEPNRFDRIKKKLRSYIEITHPTRYAIIQVQPVIPQETQDGQAPPTPVVDESQPVISVIMTRNLGDLRFPSAMITLGSGLIFGLLCNMLHRRDRVAMAVRSAVPARA